jgi:hypothetical protein
MARSRSQSLGGLPCGDNFSLNQTPGNITLLGEVF